MDPMYPLPQKGDFLQGQTWCCSHKLLNVAPYMKETSLFWVIQTCHVFLLFGVEAGVIYIYIYIHMCCVFFWRWYPDEVAKGKPKGKPFWGIPF